MRREPTFLDLLGAGAQRRLRELAVPRRYPQDSAIFREGDRSDHVVIVTSGRVKIAMLRPGVGEVVLAERGAGDVLGELSAIDGQPRSADAIALDEVEALSLLNEDFTAFLGEQPGAAVALLQTLAARLRAADRRHVEFGFTDSVTRVAKELVAMARREGSADGAWVTIASSHLELAAQLQVSPDDVTNALRILGDDGLVEPHREGVTIVDLENLEQRASKPGR